MRTSDFAKWTARFVADGMASSRVVVTAVLTPRPDAWTNAG
ncbi:hypothetical protein [Streptomyces sp. NPDC047028]